MMPSIARRPLLISAIKPFALASSEPVFGEAKRIIQVKGHGVWHAGVLDRRVDT